MCFGKFCNLALARMVDYDGPCCSLCHSITSSEPDWDGRLECEKEAGLCSVFADGIGALTGADVVTADCVASAAFESAVLDCLCMAEGIDPRLPHVDDPSAIPVDLAAKAMHIVGAARSLMAQSAGGVSDENMTAARAQIHVEDAIVSVGIGML